MNKPLFLGPSDWATSKYNNVDRTNVLDIGITSLNPSYKVPESCCKEGIDKNTCNIARSLGISSSLNPNIYHTVRIIIDWDFYRFR
jgi:CD81 antigen